MKTKNRDAAALVNPDEIRIADNLGLHGIYVHQEGPSGESYSAWVKFVPRVGETIVGEGDSQYRVVRVTHKLTEIDGLTSMIPNVTCEKVK